MADFIGVSLRTVDEYCRQGMPGDPPKRKGDQWRFESAAVVGWLRERERTSALGEVAQIDEADAKRRKLAAEAALAELELAKAQGVVVGITDISQALSQAIGAARAKLLALGREIGPQVAPIGDEGECIGVIELAVYEALQELSDFEPKIQIDAEGDTESRHGTASSSETVGATAEVDSERMGRRGKTSQRRK